MSDSRRYLGLLAILTAMVLVLTACPAADEEVADPDPAPEPDAGEVDDEIDEEAEEPQTFSLTIGGAAPTGALIGVRTVEEYFIPEVERRVAEETPHEVDFTSLWGGQQAGVGEELTAIQGGLLELGTATYPYEPASLPLHNMGFFVPFQSSDVHLVMESFLEAWENNPELNDIFESENNQKVLGHWAVGDYTLLTTFEWDSLDELRGQRVCGVGPNLTWVEPLGAVPVQAPAAEWYTSLQTGLCDGGVVLAEAVVDLSLYEVIELLTRARLGAAPAGTLNINLDVWETLPASIQDILIEVGEAYTQHTIDVIAEANEAAFEHVEQQGVRVRDLEDDIRLEWAEALPNIPNVRAQEIEEMGLPGISFTRDYIAAQEARGHVFPREYEIEG